MKKRRNIAILSHVDAGKTTLTENLLFNSGSVRSLGSVDKGTSHTDFLEVEKERGISVRAAYLSFNYNDIQVNIIDTPGHTDFSSETERALAAADSAIIIISAVEGVQSHTETLWKTVQKMGIPCLFIINKIDRAGSDYEYVVSEIKNTLSKNAISLNKVSNEATENAEIINLFSEDININNEVSEFIIEQDEILFEQYMNDEQISFQQLNNSFIGSVNKAKLFPILCTSAKHNKGTIKVLDFIEEVLPSPKIIQSEDLSGIVFKVEFDKLLGKLSYIRLFSGEILSRNLVYNKRTQNEEKVSQIKKIYTKKYEDIDKISAGDIAIISGFLQAKAGDIIGNKDLNLRNKLDGVPLLTVKVVAEKDEDYPALLKAFNQIADQDPSIDLQWLQDQREFHIKIQGNIQVEILEKILEQDYNIKAVFDEPTIIYKETPSKTAEGYVRYWMPKPCWAIMRFKIEPGERGSGVVYKSEVSVDKIKQRYQNQVASTISKALKQGIKGWEVTDIKITLIDGENHEVHTNPPDFIIATPMGIMDGLTNTGTTLLEPILNFKITATEEALGTIAGDLTRMRASFANPEFNDGKFTLEGTIPASTSLNYSVSLASKTGGKGKFYTTFNSYQACDLSLGKTCDFRGISPLDRAKYILHARNAL